MLKTVPNFIKRRILNRFKTNNEPISLGMHSSSFSSRSSSRSLRKLPICDGSFRSWFVLSTRTSRLTSLSMSGGSSLSSLFDAFSSVSDVHVPKSQNNVGTLLKELSLDTEKGYENGSGSNTEMLLHAIPLGTHGCRHACSQLCLRHAFLRDFHPLWTQCGRL